MSSRSNNLSVIHHRSGRFVGSSGFGIVTYRLGGGHGPRWQDHFQLVIMHTGCVTVSVSGRRLSAKAGMGILLPPGHLEEFQFSSRRESRHSWCQLVPEDLPDSLRFPTGVCHRPAKCSARTLELMRCGLRGDPQISGFPADAHSTTALVLATMWAFAATLGSEIVAPNPTSRGSALHRFHVAVEALGPERATLERLARQAGVSRGHLIKLVREHLGLTPMEVVWKSRLTRAARLLKETGLSVAEVADQTGFANPYHFSRRFARQFGRPPRLWRITSLGRS